MSLGVPLLRVQTDYDPLTEEKRCPHDYVPDGAFPLVMKDEVRHHSQAHEETEHGGVKEVKADGQNEFMDHC